MCGAEFAIARAADRGVELFSLRKSPRTGNEIYEPGRPCGRGLTETAANEMGLDVGTPVATSLIDAHAGGLGMIGIGLENSTDFRNRLGKRVPRCGVGCKKTKKKTNPKTVRRSDSDGSRPREYLLRWYIQSVKKKNVFILYISL